MQVQEHANLSPFPKNVDGPRQNETTAVVLNGSGSGLTAKAQCMYILYSLWNLALDSLLVHLYSFI